MTIAPPTTVAEPTVSVVIAVYNAASTLERALRSVVREQQQTDVELIVIDAGSTDGSLDIIDRYRAQIAHLVSEPDDGIYDAWNKALGRARGQWIAFLGADDEYLPGALQTYLSAIAACPRDDLHYVSSKVNVTLGGKVVRVIGRPWAWPVFQKYMTVAHVGSLHHRSLYAQFGAYDTSYRICGDYELLLRPRGRLRALFVDRPTANMAAGGVSGRSIDRALAEAQRAKAQTGGRSTLRCAIDRRWAYLKASARSLLY